MANLIITAATDDTSTVLCRVKGPQTLGLELLCWAGCELNCLEHDGELFTVANSYKKKSDYRQNSKIETKRNIPSIFNGFRSRVTKSNLHPAGLFMLDVGLQRVRVHM